MKNKIINNTWIVPALMAVCFGSASEAGEIESEPAVAATGSAGDFWNRPQLTGDWGGLRPDLSKHGIDIDLRLSQYYQGVASGGVNQTAEYGGTMDYRVNLDADKLFGAKGLSFNMHARTRYGYDINADAGALVLPNGGMMMPSPGGYHGTDITGLTATYMFPAYAGRTAVLTGGMLDVIDLVTGFFPNVGYGQEGFMNVNSLASNMPWFGAVQGLSLVGGMGVTVHPKYHVPESGFVIAGTTNVSTRIDSDMFSDSFDDGTLYAVFHRFFWDMDDKMGYFMVYVSGSTKDQASNDPNDIVNIPGQGLVNTETEKPWDIALYLYQDFWQHKSDPNRKANFMIGATVGPDNPQFAQWNLMANVEWLGSLDCRPHDRMGVSGWWNGLSDNFTDLTSAGGVDLRNPWGFEMYYNYELNPWAHLSGNLQLVQNQNQGDDFAIIPGVRMVIDF
jgi:porin